MAAVKEDSRVQGIFHFREPDTSITKDDRAFFANAAPKRVVNETIPLNDMRDDPRIVQGAGGLDTQGFAYLKSPSVLTSEEWFTGKNVEDVYIPEVCDLICKVTGAKRAIVNNTAFRRKTVDAYADPKFYHKKDGPLDKEIQKMPRDQAMVYGKSGSEKSLEPSRPLHVDYTVTGLRNTVRYCRKDIAEMAKEVIDTEAALARGEDVTIPRYAAYSVWRPVKVVKRDPLVVADYRTIDKSDFAENEYRALSEINENGEYTMEYWAALPPKDKLQAQWYYAPDMQPDEVLIVKFADTEADKDKSIAAFGAHGAIVLPNSEEEEARCSIECRVLAFW